MPDQDHPAAAPLADNIASHLRNLLQVVVGIEHDTELARGGNHIVTSSELSVIRSRAEAAIALAENPDMTKWEYFASWCNYDQINQELAVYGKEGWELVSAVFNDPEARWYLILKRPAE